VRLELVTMEHAPSLERFERDNREFFAARIADRGDDYFEHFTERLAALVRENLDGRSLLAVVVDDSGDIVARVNITDIDQPGSTQIGFRVAERVQGRGVASTGVTLALELAATRGVRTVLARVSTTNLASQRVLERCGFQPTGPAEPPKGSSRIFIGYRRDIEPG
jgi:[ribosomal protein S5]-alanine N-acetyltransferase